MNNTREPTAEKKDEVADPVCGMTTESPESYIP